MASNLAIAAEPYNVGKPVFSEHHLFGKSKRGVLNVEEKKQRLIALRKSLPNHAREKLDPATLAQHLTNREESTLEYYIRVRFKKYLNDPPSWADEEPPAREQIQRLGEVARQ